MNKTMAEREKQTNGIWKDEGNGYFSMIGHGGFYSPVAYIALPKGHPDIKKDYNNIDAPVNGGLTFGENNIFGWDYAHAYNYGTPENDIKKALVFFRKRFRKGERVSER